MQVPVTVLNATTKREQGRKAQVGNIAAAKVRAQKLLSVRPSDMRTALNASRGVGCGRHHQDNARAAIHAEDAAGPKWRCVADHWLMVVAIHGRFHLHCSSNLGMHVRPVGSLVAAAPVLCSNCCNLT